MKMTIKKLLTVLAIIGACSFTMGSVANAQDALPKKENKIQVIKQKTTTLMHKFQKTDDSQKAFDVLKQVKKSLMGELAASKKSVANEMHQGNKKMADAYLKLNETLAQVYNKLVTASRSVDKMDRATINKAIEKYNAIKRP